MGYKLRNGLFFFLIAIYLCSCDEKSEPDTKDIFYIDYINSTDSLHKRLDERTNGKVSYYKDNKLNIISLNYVTDKHPGMHYFRSIKELPAAIPEGSQKIRVEFSGNLTKDSTFYSIQRFKFKNKEWNKTGDMGTIRAESISRSTTNRNFSHWELSEQVIKTIVEYTYQ